MEIPPNNEPSIADDIYSKRYGIETKEEDKPINAQLVGYVKKQGNRPLTPPVPVYKNPKNLEGFSEDTRGVLLNDGDLYLAKD